MSKVSADTLKSLDPTQDLTIGTTGQTVTLPGNDLRVNTFKDKGGNTLWTSDGSGTLSSVNSGLKGSFILIQTQAISSAVANITFTTLDSTYDAYVFKFIAMHPSVDGQEFRFQVNASGQTGFNETMTTTFFDADHTEADVGSLNYESGDDQSQGTAYQKLCRGQGSDDDEAMSGELYLFSPSNTTHVKQFFSRTAEYMSSPRILDNYVAGYINTTAAITEIDFKFNTGNMDAGTIIMYGIL